VQLLLAKGESNAGSALAAVAQKSRISVIPGPTANLIAICTTQDQVIEIFKCVEPIPFVGGEQELSIRYIRPVLRKPVASSPFAGKLCAQIHGFRRRIEKTIAQNSPIQPTIEPLKPVMKLFFQTGTCQTLTQHCPDYGGKSAATLLKDEPIVEEKHCDLDGIDFICWFRKSWFSIHPHPP
jgi:hypothetical protein